MRRRRSRTHLRLKVQHLYQARGYIVEPVESYNPRTKRLHDLYGIFDLMAVRSGVGGIVGVQVSPASRLADHRKKMFHSPALIPWITGGGRAVIASLRIREVRVRLIGGSWDLPLDDGKRGWIILIHEWRLTPFGIPSLRVVEGGRLARLVRVGSLNIGGGDVQRNREKTRSRSEVVPGPCPRSRMARRESPAATGRDRRGEVE